MAQKPARIHEGHDALVKRRTEMAKTRDRLEKKLTELKQRFLHRIPHKKDNDMAAKTIAAAKKKTPAKKTKAVKTVKKTAENVMEKTKEVLGEMLAGAAVGAVKGAAEAVAPPDAKGSNETKTKSKTRKK